MVRDEIHEDIDNDDRVYECGQNKQNLTKN